ncbi:MAG: hypothetical protein WD886_01680 [Burkholderiales bacterium]
MPAPRRRAAALSRPDLLRLQRLAGSAGTTPVRVLRWVLRDGFEYTEWFVRQVNESEVDLRAGRVMSTAEVLALIEKQRRETAHLTRSRANLRRLVAAHAEIEADIARRRGDRAAARAFLANAGRVAAAGVRPLSADRIQAEIDALRGARRKPRRAARRVRADRGRAKRGSS